MTATETEELLTASSDHRTRNNTNGTRRGTTEGDDGISFDWVII